jgi:hypothetical protein
VDVYTHVMSSLPGSLSDARELLSTINSDWWECTSGLKQCGKQVGSVIVAQSCVTHVVVGLCSAVCDCSTRQQHSHFTGGVGFSANLVGVSERQNAVHASNSVRTLPSHLIFPARHACHLPQAYCAPKRNLLLLLLC